MFLTTHLTFQIYNGWKCVCVGGDIYSIGPFASNILRQMSINKQAPLVKQKPKGRKSEGFLQQGATECSHVPFIDFNRLWSQTSFVQRGKKEIPWTILISLSSSFPRPCTDYRLITWKMVDHKGQDCNTMLTSWQL